MSKLLPGYSFTVAIGKWAKPHLRYGEMAWGVCLGFVALTFYRLDIEELITRLNKENRQLKRRLENYNKSDSAKGVL